MYPELGEWLRIRDEVDPEGMFVGDWHRRLLLDEEINLQVEERKGKIRPAWGGGVEWFGEVKGWQMSPLGSEESFEMMHGVEAEKSVVFDQDVTEEDEL